MITERTLRNWRRDALTFIAYKSEETPLAALARENNELRQRILRMTAELLDQHLLERSKK